MPRLRMAAGTRLITSLSSSGVSEFTETRVLPFPPAHVFSVIAGVEHYHQFVPWCVTSTVTSRSSTGLKAELSVGFGRFLCGAYTSAVTFEPSRLVRAVASGTPLFEVLENDWSLSPGLVRDTTTLRFAVRWRFRSALLGGASEAFKEQVARRMVAAFDARCAMTAEGWAVGERVRIEAEAREGRRVGEVIAESKGDFLTLVNNSQFGLFTPVSLPASPSPTTICAPPRFPPPMPLPPGLW